MKMNFISLTFVLSMIASKAFCMENNDIFPPDVENYDGKSRIGGWRLKKPNVYEEQAIPVGEPLYPYHAWIKYNDKDNLPLHCIFYTLHEDRKGKALVSFVYDEPVDPTQYRFERTTDVNHLIKAPYTNDKTGKIEGEKFDAWNLQETEGSKKDQKKNWDPMPDHVRANHFPAVFRYHGNSEK